MTEEERDPADPWLTLAEIADELRVNPATVRQWVSKGKLKASRAGVRKWIVRRSDLDRFLAATNSSPDDVLDRVARGEPPQLTASPPRRPNPGVEEAPEAAPPRKPRTAKAEGPVELLRLAISGHQDAMMQSAYALPSPGYVDRIRAIADSCEHVAVTMLNASHAAGIRWRSKADLADGLPYELKRGGNRPGPAAVWEEFDAAYERLAITATGTDTVAVAHGYREVGDALLSVADKLDADAEWHAWERHAT